MGIWHKRTINNQYFFISFDTKEVNLGLLSPKNSPRYLYLFNDIKQIHIAVDGRIYNKQVLCRKLNLNNDVAIGSVIIELYENYGFEGLYQLDGAFSLILVDRKKQMTLLYRSFLTGHPLYYVAKNNLLSVSTNPVDLLHRPDVSDSLNLEQMSANFSLDMIAWNDTVFSDLSEVQHGEIVMVSSKGIESTKRDLSKILMPTNYGSESETINTYRHLVESAVETNIFSDKKYGIMLSSGIDSSTLAVFASQYLKKQGSALHAYSWSLPNYQQADETKKIKELCSGLGIDLHLFDAEKFEPFSELDNLVQYPDTPFTNLFSPMLSQLYQNASKDGMNVLFNGHYGDNLFPSTRNLFVDILKDKRFELFLPTMKSVISQVGYRNAIKKSPSIRGFIKHYLPFYKSTKPVVYTPEWLSSEARVNRMIAWQNKKTEILGGYEAFSYALSKHSTSSGMGRYDTEKFGIERIEPFRDVEILNYTLRLPSYMSYRDGQMKYVAREAMRGLVPESIRTQGRVGLLNQFAYDGFMKHKNEVRERLFDEREPWRIYVDEKWMEEKFKKNAEVKDKDILVIWMSLHMAPWQKAIKPGGSLYEGTFMQNGAKS